MKILVPGNKEKLSQKAKFKCNNCECEFEAVKGEHTRIVYYGKVTYYAKCPRCNETVKSI